VNFKTVETGFEIRPVVSGDNVRIDIVPRISRVGKGCVIHFTEAATSVVVPRGKWVTIGGISESKNEVIRDILSGGSTEKYPTSSMSLMVEP
jgi:type II secretory pathway component GspD/PulD (secretin)